MKTILILIFSMFSVAQAADIGTAGCGLGNVLMGGEHGMKQIFVATTNGTSGNQTFGITSGTSNCTDSGRSAQLNNFIESNKVALTKEAARGEGQTLEGLTQVLGCKADFSAKVKNHYQQIFSTDKTEEISSKILQVAQNNPGVCS